MGVISPRSLSEWAFISLCTSDLGNRVTAPVPSSPTSRRQPFYLQMWHILTLRHNHHNHITFLKKESLYCNQELCTRLHVPYAWTRGSGDVDNYSTKPPVIWLHTAFSHLWFRCPLIVFSLFRVCFLNVHMNSMWICKSMKRWDRNAHWDANIRPSEEKIMKTSAKTFSPSSSLMSLFDTFWEYDELSLEASTVKLKL